MTAAALRPFVIQAEREVGIDGGLYDVRDRLYYLILETARRVVDNDGESLALMQALNHLTEAHSRFGEAVEALLDARAAELFWGTE